jgi:hypothetical protein
LRQARPVQWLIAPPIWRKAALRKLLQRPSALSMRAYTTSRQGKLALFLHSCQSGTALPQCQSSTVVQRRCRRISRTILVKVFSGHIGDLGRRREIDDCLSAFGRGYCEKLGEPSQARDQTAAFIGEACRDETGMQTIRSQAGAMQAPSKLARKQDVAKL